VILADTVGVTLRNQLNITVATQSLYRFRIGLDADKERCQAVTQVSDLAFSDRTGYQNAEHADYDRSSGGGTAANAL
jgi:hypothetical protein